MLAPDEKETHAQRIARAEAELKKDPARSDRLISNLIGISKASVYRLRSQMEVARIIDPVPYGKRISVTGKARPAAIPGEMAGPRIKVPDGMSLVDLIHQGIELEAEGKSTEDAAYLIGVGSASYRQARTIVQLSERPGLTSREKEVTDKALALLVEERRSRHAFNMVKEISDRVWGKGTNPRSEKTAQRIIENFMNAISVITIACDKGRELEIPQLSANDATAVILQLRDSMQSLKELRSNLNRRIR